MKFATIIPLCLTCLLLKLLMPLLGQPQQPQNTFFFQRNAPTVLILNDLRFGDILTDGRNMTLYTFADDGNTSTCYDDCATTWPPFLIPYGQPVITPWGFRGALGSIRRGDNTRQLTYNGQPLYFFSRDTLPGDKRGHGVDRKWSVVRVF
jgi:predicted lipoprotein with Yx(FWY)xxD motif